jgi:hypothetical protein
LVSMADRVVGVAAPVGELGSDSEAADHESTGSGTAEPVPDIGTAWGEPAALSLTVRLALAPPSAVGLNTALIVQLVPGFKIDGQLCVALNGAARPIEEIVSAALPELVMMTARAADGVPTCCPPNPTDVGDRETTGAGALAPLPDRETAVDPVPALCVKVKAPVRVPVAVGVKTSRAVQLEPAVTGTPMVHGLVVPPE